MEQGHSKAYSLTFFQKKFKPITNQFRPHTTMFETVGKEHDYIMSLQPYYAHRIYTLCEYDGSMLVYPGYRLVNRLGYYVLPLTESDIVLDNMIDDVVKSVKDRLEKAIVYNNGESTGATVINNIT